MNQWFNVAQEPVTNRFIHNYVAQEPVTNRFIHNYENKLTHKLKNYEILKLIFLSLRIHKQEVKSQYEFCTTE